MKSALYEPVKGVLLNVQEAPFRSRETDSVAPRFVEWAQKTVGALPGVAFCVWDDVSLRIFPLHSKKPPTFQEVAVLVRAHGYKG
jgi:hypothetical protein